MEKYQGVLKDKRSKSLKAKDFKHEEFIYGLSPIDWKIKTQEEWKKYSVRDQDGSFSCIFQGIAKAVETFSGISESARYYRLRNNFPSKGAWLYDGANILDLFGIEIEKDLPSQKMSEEQMNTDISFGICNLIDKYDISYFYVNSKNIDDIASAIENYKHCVLTFESNHDEWKDVPEVKGFIKFGHCVCATDYTIFEGEKSIIVDESWGVGVTKFNAQRVIKESFLKKRCTGALYFVITEKKTQTIKYKFNFPLKLGSKGKDVLMLQEILVIENCLKPVWLEDSKKYGGIFGQRTLNAVIKLQEKYFDEILKPVGLFRGTGYVGDSTLSFLNKKYGQ